MTSTRRTVLDISDEWDRVAEKRHRQIVSGVDLSFNKVLVPAILKTIGKVSGLGVLDAGCGSGVLCHKLSQLGAQVTGVDSSKKMIAIARREYGSSSNLHFCNETIERFGTDHPTEFDICVSNMALVTMPNIESITKSISTLLRPRGRFVFSITHPFFWNKHRKYEPEKNFEYMNTHAQTGTFEISLDKSMKERTTHFHRPLSAYFNSLFEAGFLVQRLIEPFPQSKDMSRYPIPWTFPRFLCIAAILNESK